MGEIRNDIIEMNNIQIKDNILSINAKQLENIKKASYFNVFHSIIGVKKLLEGKVEGGNLGPNKELELFNNYIEGAINSIILSVDRTSGENHELELESLIEIKKDLYGMLLIVEGYLIELSHMGLLVDEYGIKMLSKRDYNNIAYDSEKIDELIGMINQILTDNEDHYNRYIYIISEIILILPMRLVKENYYNIIKDTLMRNLKTYTKVQIENQINYYKKQFDSSIRNGYGTKFDYCFTEIQKLKNINIKNKNLKDLSDLVNRISNLTKEINELRDIILILGLVNNMDIVINLTQGIPMDKEVYKIYEQWINVLQNKNEQELEKVISIIGMEIESIEKHIFKDLDRFQSLNIEALKREDFDHDELNEELTYTKTILAYYNDSEFMDQSLMLPINEEDPSYEYLEQSVDSLIQYINRSINSMNNFERRIRMRKLLSIIELPFSGVEDFSNYIRYSLDNRIILKEEINFIIDHILYFLNDFTKS